MSLQAFTPEALLPEYHPGSFELGVMDALACCCVGARSLTERLFIVASFPDGLSVAPWPIDTDDAPTWPQMQTALQHADAGAGQRPTSLHVFAYSEQTRRYAATIDLLQSAAPRPPSGERVAAPETFLVHADRTGCRLLPLQRVPGLLDQDSQDSHDIAAGLPVREQRLRLLVTARDLLDRGEMNAVSQEHAILLADAFADRRLQVAALTWQGGAAAHLWLAVAAAAPTPALQVSALTFAANVLYQQGAHEAAIDVMGEAAERDLTRSADAVREQMRQHSTPATVTDLITYTLICRTALAGAMT